MTTPVLKTTQPVRQRNPATKATSMANLLFGRPNLDKAERILNDFGLLTVQKKLIRSTCARGLA